MSQMRFDPKHARMLLAAAVQDTEIVYVPLPRATAERFVQTIGPMRESAKDVIAACRTALEATKDTTTTPTGGSESRRSNQTNPSNLDQPGEGESR